MALWVAGKAFRCKGAAATDPNYNGHDMTREDMKKIVQRFYRKKAENEKRAAGSGGMALTSDHRDEIEVGDVHHMFVDKNYYLWNVARLSPTGANAQEYAKRVKSGDDKLKVGLSYDFKSQEHSWDKDSKSEIKNKSLRKLSLVDNPAYHDDDTYVTVWDDTEEGVLKKLFADIYGPTGDDTINKPDFITNSLRDRVRDVFKSGPAEDDAMEIDEDNQKNKKQEEEDKTPAKDKKAEEKKAKPSGEDASKKEADGTDLEKKKSGSKPDAAKESKSKSLFNNSSDKNGKAGNNSDSLAASSGTKTMSGEDKGNEMEVDQENDTNEEKQEGDKGKLSGSAKKKGTTTTKTQEGVKSKAPVKKSKVDESKEGGEQTRGKKRPAPDEDEDVEEDEAEEQEEDGDEGNGEAMDTDEAAEQSEQEEGTPQDDEDVEMKEADDDDTGEAEEKPTAKKATKKPAEAPPRKKQKGAEGKGKTTQTKSSVVHRDAEMQQLEIRDSMDKLFKLRGIMRDPDAQNEFVNNMLVKELSRAEDALKAQAVILKQISKEQGIPQETLTKLARISAEDPDTGAAVREVLSAAANYGMSHKMREMEYQQNRSGGGSKSIFDGGGNVRGNSIFSKAGNSSMDEASASLFSILSSGGGSSSNQSSFWGNHGQQQQQQQQRSMNNNNNNQARKKETKTESHPRLGGKSERVVTPEEKQRLETEKRQQEYTDRINKAQPYRIRRLIPLDAKNPLASIKTEEGLSAIDNFDLRENTLENIPAGGYTHRFLNAFAMPNLTAVEKKQYHDYGHDTINDNYYGVSDPIKYQRNPRRVMGGLVTLGDERVDAMVV